MTPCHNLYCGWYGDADSSYTNRRGDMRLISRVILATLGTGAILLAGGWCYQTIAEWRDDAKYPRPGELFSVEGRAMHIRCRGHGSPTVVVEQGLGGPSLDWNAINEQMSHITRVCDYDRAGMGYSEPANKPTRVGDVVENLNLLLSAANIDDDLILLGWSAGGMYAREYYRRYPARVKGLVLVDSAHEQQSVRMPAPSNQDNLKSLKRNHLFARIGWLRFTDEVKNQFARSPLQGEERNRLIAIFEKSHTYQTLFYEGVGFEQDLASGMNPPTLGNVPVIVIAEGKPRSPFMQENLALWHEMQRELSELSSDGRFVIAENSAHFIHRSEPELIVSAVSDVAAAIRSGRSLSPQASISPTK